MRHRPGALMLLDKSTFINAALTLGVAMRHRQRHSHARCGGRRRNNRVTSKTGGDPGK
jgi:hypothetical protein